MMHKRLTLITPPTVPAVTLADAKLHLRVDGDDEDVIIATMLEAAIRYLDGPDGVLGRALAPQEWEVVFDRAAGRIPLEPVIDQDDPVDENGEVRIRFRAGYPDGVPAPIRAAILLHVGTLYQNREQEADKFEPTRVYEALLAPYRRWIG